MYYCNGKYCSKKEDCAHHQPDTSGKLQQSLDMSTQGSGRYWNDEDGTPRSEVEVWCGDESVDYKYFKPCDNDNRRLDMKVVLIKWKSRWEDCEEVVGIAADREAAFRHTKELAAKYPDCYGDHHGTWHFEDFDLIKE